MPPSDPLPAPVAAHEPEEPTPEAAAPGSVAYLMLGFVLLTACLEIGERLKQGFQLVLPGSILGLFLLLALLGAGAVPLRWVASTAGWLLWLLPLLFMPIFTLALRDHQFWLAQGRAIALAVAAGTLLLLVFVGHLAQWMLRAPPGGGNDRPPPSSENARSPMSNDQSSAVGGTRGTLGLLAIPIPLVIGHWASELGPSAVRAAVWSLVTVTVYFACRWVFLRTRWSLLYPGLTGILTMVVILECAGRTYIQYEHATAWINWLLGPAVVAMAVPIYQLRRTVRDNARVLAVAIPLGLAFAAVTTPGLLASLGRPRPVVAAGALKSITSPVGLRLALDSRVSKDAALAGILLAGMLGATLGTPVLRQLGVYDERAIGLALGCTSHGIGVARALETGRAGGAFASLGMSGTAILGALALPFVLRWIMGGG